MKTKGITLVWWRRIGAYLHIRKIEETEIRDLLSHHVFHNELSLRTFIVRTCLKYYEDVFKKLGRTSTRYTTLIMELYWQCAKQNPFLPSIVKDKLNLDNPQKATKSNCKCNTWYAHQVSRDIVKIDNNKQPVELIKSYYDGEFFGPYECTNCGKIVKEL